MPRKITGKCSGRCRKPERRLWTADKLSQAIKSEKHGMSRNQAARIYGIPKRTLRRYLHSQLGTIGNPEQVKLNPLRSFKSVFTQEQEQQLVDYAIDMGECFYGLNAREMRSLAF
ncbi:AAEL003751-PA [Aedes aegypti]|uniref:AAEL003751-PA n=1 Tax=Aedes aegypti TaxID=7159 RepID=Q0IG05_AEDAE|nr:AAEL003751-PA [Aedes aegypti]